MLLLCQLSLGFGFVWRGSWNWLHSLLISYEIKEISEPLMFMCVLALLSQCTCSSKNSLVLPLKGFEFFQYDSWLIVVFNFSQNYCHWIRSGKEWFVDKPCRIFKSRSPGLEQCVTIQCTHGSVDAGHLLLELDSFCGNPGQTSMPCSWHCHFEKGQGALAVSHSETWVKATSSYSF